MHAFFLASGCSFVNKFILDLTVTFTRASSPIVMKITGELVSYLCLRSSEGSQAAQQFYLSTSTIFPKEVPLGILSLL
jgi:hypothetical protein